MKVILQQNVQKLGKAGDIVEASPGYFRNFLQPRKLAVLATPGTLKKREEDAEVLKKRAAAAHQEAVDLAAKISNVGTIILTVKAGEGGKLYGKITNKEVAIALEKALGSEIDKRLVKPLQDINALGTFNVVVKLAPDVQGEFQVDVKPEGYYPRETKETKETDAEAEAAEEVAEPVEA